MLRCCIFYLHRVKRNTKQVAKVSAPTMKLWQVAHCRQCCVLA